MSQPLQSLTLKLHNHANVQLISQALLELGALSVTTTDLYQHTNHESPIYSEPPQTTPPSPWSNAKVTALFPFTPYPDTLLQTITTALSTDLPPPSITLTPFPNKPPAEWVRAAQALCKPVDLGRATLIFPWHAPQPGTTNIVLQPGLAFGTGDHPTTRLCARWLLRQLRPHVTVLDYGTGSGVLAIVAAAVGEDVSAVGVDIDPDAVRVARENARMNGVEGRVAFWGVEENLDQCFDIVVANILVGPLLCLAPVLVGRMRTGGKIALSGILVEQAEEVCAAYRTRGVRMDEAIIEDGWAMVVGVKE